MLVTALPAPIGPMTSNEVTANKAEDSISMAAIALYNPPIPAVDSVATGNLLPCKISRTTIMSVRRMLSETEIEKYGRLKSMSAFRSPIG